MLPIEAAALPTRPVSPSVRTSTWPLGLVLLG